MKSTTEQPLKRIWTLPIIESGKLSPFGLNWFKTNGITYWSKGNKYIWLEHMQYIAYCRANKERKWRNILFTFVK